MRYLIFLFVTILIFSYAKSSDAKVDDPGVQPNIILIMADDQDGSRETISKMPYLYSRTPEGGGGWYRFDNAFINNATCCPSRATILTGKWSHHTGVEVTGGSPPFDDTDTIAKRLNDAGYKTCFMGKYHLGSTIPISSTFIPPGWDCFVDHKINLPNECGEGSSGAYYNYALNDNGTIRCYGSDASDYSTDVLKSKVVDFINESATSQPFFLMFAPRAPHNPWTAADRDIGNHSNDEVTFPPSWNEDTSDKPIWWASRSEVSEGNRRGPMRKEWDTLGAMDDAVSAIQHRVQNLGIMSDTIVLYMSDNGFSFGEHRWGDKRCIYDSCTKTPLYIKYGSHTEGTIFTNLIGNEDLATTFTELGQTIPPSNGDGQSFALGLKNRVAPVGWNEEVLLRSANPNNNPGNPPDAWAIRTNSYKYAITTNTLETELYDLTVDPHELNNVSGEPEYAAIESALATRLALLRL